MKININNEKKIVSIWVNNRIEAKNVNSEKLNKKIEQYNKEKYKVCVYQSGREDAKKNILNLIRNNAN